MLRCAKQNRELFAKRVHLCTKVEVLGQSWTSLFLRRHCKKSASAANGRGVPLDMSRIHPEYSDSDPCDRSAAADVVVRQEPDEEDDEEDQGDGAEDNDDDDNDDGYSE